MSDKGPDQANITQNSEANQNESAAIVEEVANPAAIESIDASIINKLNRIASEDPNRSDNHFESTSASNRAEKTTSPDRFVRSDVTSSYDTTEITESVTKTARVDLLPQTTEFETRTRAPVPRFIPKLSYFKNPVDFGGSDINLVERAGKKRFRSRCRCEKIWNCPKLQITVPRCPEEYFMCCF